MIWMKQWCVWVVGLTVAIGAAGWPGGAAAQQDKPLEKVRIGVATQVINLTYPWLTLPVALGYWEREGFDVSLIPVSGSMEAVQQLAAGNIDFAQTGASIVIQARANNNLPVRALVNNTVIDWSVSVLENSDIQHVSDLKGKQIGILSLASAGVPLLRSYLSANGVNPDRDVRIIPVGAGAPALAALQSDKVQALMFWQSANVGFENAGAKLRYFVDSRWRTWPDFSVAVHEKMLENRPELVAAITRGLVRASIYVQENPSCARKLHWEAFPDTKPTGAPKEVLIAREERLLSAQLRSMREAYVMNDSPVWGQASAAAFGQLQAFMLEHGLIKRTLDPAEFVVDLSRQVPGIDQLNPDRVREDAKACSPGER